MHILYIHQHFAIPKGSTGTRSYEFARRWIKAGHKVTLITGYYEPGGLKLGKGLIQKQTIDEIEIKVIAATYNQKQSYLRRLVSFLSFMLLSIYVGMRTKNIDIIYATSTPLTVGISAMVIKWLKRVPFVFEVRDQWPKIPIEMGIIKNRVIIKILLWAEKVIYKKSSAIVALSPGMANGIESVLKKRKDIVVIPNCSDTEMFRPDIDSSAIRQEKGWDNKLVLLHFGAMGRVNGLEFVIEAANRLRSNTEVQFVLVGEGREKASLIKKLEQLGLKNVDILDSVPKEKLVKLVAACDISMIVVANFSILEHNSANKFFDSLSASKPVLLNYSGWQRKILEDNEAGFGCNLYDIDEFVEKVLYLHSHREDLRKMGENARRIAIEKFNRDKLAKEALQIISSATK
jgi:glycosyltransferase involved in cell wall biosynthesis